MDDWITLKQTKTLQMIKESHLSEEGLDQRKRTGKIKLEVWNGPLFIGKGKSDRYRPTAPLNTRRLH